MAAENEQHINDDGSDNLQKYWRLLSRALLSINQKHKQEQRLRFRPACKTIQQLSASSLTPHWDVKTRQNSQTLQDYKNNCKYRNILIKYWQQLPSVFIENGFQKEYFLLSVKASRIHTCAWKSFLKLL